MQVCTTLHHSTGRPAMQCNAMPRNAMQCTTYNTCVHTFPHMTTWIQTRQNSVRDPWLICLAEFRISGHGVDERKTSNAHSESFSLGLGPNLTYRDASIQFDKIWQGRSLVKTRKCWVFLECYLPCSHSFYAVLDIASQAFVHVQSEAKPSLIL